MTTNKAIGPLTTATIWVDRIANLVHELRPDWDEAGIRSALRKVSDRPLHMVAAAALAACQRIDQRTPAVIALDGDHWRVVGAPALPDPVPCEVCRMPGPEACAHAQRIVLDEELKLRHEYQPSAPRQASGRRAARPLPDWGSVLPNVDPEAAP